MTRITIVSVLTLVLVIHSAADAQLGLCNFGPRFGKDVVSGDDTRTFYMLQADIAQLWTPRLLLEVAAETGSGRDLQGEDVEVSGGSIIFKYYWANKKKTAYAFSGGGIGISRYRRLLGGEFRTEIDTSIHFVLVGMERHVFQKRVKGVLDIRWLIGKIEGASAMRVGLGVSYLLKSP